MPVLILLPEKLIFSRTSANTDIDDVSHVCFPIDLCHFSSIPCSILILEEMIESEGTEILPPPYVIQDLHTVRFFIRRLRNDNPLLVHQLFISVFEEPN